MGVDVNSNKVLPGRNGIRRAGRRRLCISEDTEERIAWLLPEVTDCDPWSGAPGCEEALWSQFQSVLKPSAIYAGRDLRIVGENVTNLGADLTAVNNIDVTVDSFSNATGVVTALRGDYSFFEGLSNDPAYQLYRALPTGEDYEVNQFKFFPAHLSAGNTLTINASSEILNGVVEEGSVPPAISTVVDLTPVQGTEEVDFSGADLGVAPGGGTGTQPPSSGSSNTIPAGQNFVAVNVNPHIPSGNSGGTEPSSTTPFRISLLMPVVK